MRELQSRKRRAVAPAGAAVALLLVFACDGDPTKPPVVVAPADDPVTGQWAFPGLRAEATTAGADSIPAIRESAQTDSFTVAFWDGEGQVFVLGPDDRVEINVDGGRCQDRCRVS
jgi:hypothetical protein